MKKLFITQERLHVLQYMYLYMSSLCCSQKRQDHFVRSKVMCETERNTAVVRIWLILSLIQSADTQQVAQCGERWLATMRDMGSANPNTNSDS